MKNLVIIAVLVIAGFLAYNYFNQSRDVVSEDAGIGSTATSSTAPENADVFILEPGDGSVVNSPLTVKFGVANMQIVPAGSDVENSGHHHLLIDVDELPDMTQPLPATEQIMHFGAGQTEATIDLSPGEHTLQLVLGNYLHIPHQDPIISKKITVRVKSKAALSK